MNAAELRKRVELLALVRDGVVDPTSAPAAAETIGVAADILEALAILEEQGLDLYTPLYVPNGSAWNFTGNRGKAFESPVAALLALRARVKG
jgi:hypothetical protein